MIYYFLLMVAAILVSMQFVFNKAYQETVGYTTAAGASFLAISSLMFALLMLIYTGFKVNFNGFTILVAAITGLLCAGFSYFSVAVLKNCSMAQYTLYVMLGGMTLPFVYGLLVQGEVLTWQKAVCFVIIAVAMFLDGAGQSGKKGGWRTWVSLAGIFVLNGASGILNVVHQQPPEGISAGNSMDFTFWLQVFCFIFGLIMMEIMRVHGEGVSVPKEKKNLLRALGACGGYAVVHGIAILLNLIALEHLEASMLFPIYTGGTVILGVVVGLFFREKVTTRKMLCAGITLLGTLVLIIP